MLLTPLLGQLALEGVFEHGLAVDFELRPRRFQGGDAVVQVAEQFLDFGDDALLLGEGREFNYYSICIVSTLSLHFSN
jgi:hypothetical protein